MAESDARANQKQLINFTWPKRRNLRIAGTSRDV